MGQTSHLGTSSTPVRFAGRCAVCSNLDVDVDYVAVNGMKIKKAVSFAGDWGKVPVFTNGRQTPCGLDPIMRVIDEKYNGGKMANQGDPERQSEWMAWLTHFRRATFPSCTAALALR